MIDHCINKTILSEDLCIYSYSSNKRNDNLYEYNNIIRIIFIFFIFKVKKNTSL